MSPLTASNVDSRYITYSLSNVNGVRTATIPVQTYPNNMGGLVAFIGQTVVIKCRKNTNFALDHVAGNGFSTTNDTVIYTVGSGDTNRKFIIDNKGRIICAAYPNKCLCRSSVDNRVRPTVTSTLAENDQKQYWGMNASGQLHAQDDPTWRLEVTDGNMWDNRYVRMVQGIDHADARDKWNFAVFGTNELIIKRGVMDANGVIYKLVSIADNALVNMSSYTKVSIPHWNLRALPTYRNSFPSGALEIKFRDTFAIKRIGNVCKRWLFRYIAPTGYFYINCVTKIVRATSDFTEFVDINVGSETQINDLIKIGSSDMWVVCESNKIYKLNNDWLTFTQYTVTNIASVNCIMLVGSMYYVCGKANAGSTTAGAVCRTNSLTGTWTRVLTSGSELHELAYFTNGPTYVATSKTVTTTALSKCHKSTDGTTWASAYGVTWGINFIGETYTRVKTTYATAQNRFILATGNGIWNEQTGTTFMTGLVTSTESLVYNGACIFNGRLMIYGNNGELRTTSSDYNLSALTRRTLPAGKTNININYFTHSADYAVAAGDNSTLLYCKNNSQYATWSDQSPPQSLGNFIDVTVMNHRWTCLSDQGYVYTKYIDPNGTYT